MYWLADVAPFPNQQSNSFKLARYYAKLKAEAKKPPPPPPPSTTVAICGACSNEGQKNPKASYAVFWGEGDDRNDRGLVTGKQTHLRAEYFALRCALQTALLKNVTNLHVLTRNVSIKNSIRAFNGTEAMKKSLDPVALECKDMAEKLELTVEHIAPLTVNWELDKAKAMAKQEDGIDSNSNIEVFSESMMDKLDQIILGSELYEQVNTRFLK